MHVVGRVESGGVSGGTLEMGGQRIDRAYGDHVVVRTADSVVRIRIAASALVPASIDGRWGEVARLPLAAAFIDVAPGDHVNVRLHGAVVAIGDHIAARVRTQGAELVAERAATGADNDAAMAALSQAEGADQARDEDARRNASAAAARAELARVTPRVPWGRMTLALGAGALGIAAMSAALATGWRGAIPRGDHVAALWVLAIGLGGAASMTWSTRHDLPFVVHRVGETREAASRQLVVAIQLFASFMAIMIALGRSRSGVAHPEPVAALWIVCITPAVTAVLGIVRASSAVRALWPVERAARLPIPPPPHTWGVIEGVIAGSGPAVLSATTKRSTESAGSGRGGWVWEEIAVTTTPVQAFDLDAGAWRAQILPAAMIWAAPPVWQPPDETGAIHAVAAVRPGDRVRVLARTGAAGDHSLRAGGPESLFLVSGTPSAFFRRALRPPVVIALYVALVIASTLV
jgi:hypothetical protein